MVDGRCIAFVQKETWARFKFFGRNNIYTDAVFGRKFSDSMGEIVTNWARRRNFKALVLSLLKPALAVQ